MVAGALAAFLVAAVVGGVIAVVFYGTGGTAGGGGGSGGGSGGGAGGMATAMPMPPTVALRLVGTSWVEVRGPDGEVLTTGICREGDHAEFRQRSVRVIVGNAAAVRLEANGMPVELGGPGEVRVLTVTRGGAGD